MEPAKKQLRLMFLGTCRLQDPARVLRDTSNMYIRFAWPRLHSPRQILRIIQHITKVDPVRPEIVHLVFDRAADRVFKDGLTREEFIASLEGFTNAWKTYDAFVIEISTLREHFAISPDGDFLINSFAERDQAKYAQNIEEQATAGLSVPHLPVRSEVHTTANLRIWLRRIKDATNNKPVIWVSHMRPVGDETRFAEVTAARLRLSNALRTIAGEFSDAFVDPTDYAAEMGQKAFFQADGEDLNHLTTAAAERMAEVYKDLALRVTSRAG